MGIIHLNMSAAIDATAVPSLYTQIFLCKKKANLQTIYNIFIKTNTYYNKQAFDSIAGNTVVPYRSLKKIFIYHKLLFIVIYNSTFR